MRFAYSPAIGSLPDDQRDELQAAVRRRWAKLVAASALFLLLSGFYNAGMAAMNWKMVGEFGGLYNPLLGVKLLLALAVFAIASLLSGRSEGAEKFRQKESMWLNVNVLLTIVLVCIAGVMKVTEREPKPKKEPTETTQAAPLEPGASGDRG